MYTRLADKLILVAGDVVASEGVDMSGANAVQVEYTVMSWSGTGTLTFATQDTNDSENWKDTLGTQGTGGTATGAGYNHFKVTGVAAQRVRIKYSLSAGTAVLSVGINTALL
jgi:hypothetical protein